MAVSPSLPPQAARRARANSPEIALLRGHPVFGALEPEQLEQLVSYARTRKVAAGTTLFSKGDPGTELFAVSAGTVKISVPAPDGREAMFNLLHPGEIFGEIALLDGRPRTADAMAMTDCELTVIERRDFLAFVHGEPNVALQLIALLCERLRIASEHYEEVVFLDLPTRLARILLQLAEQNEAGAEEPKLKITQREISQMLGSTRESVNKQLRAWAKRGFIALERGGIAVYRLAALAAIAGGVGKRDQ
jgi:CRP/FNR family cyclic AMP-dependent transcriptional regulator